MFCHFYPIARGSLVFLYLYHRLLAGKVFISFNCNIANLSSPCFVIYYNVS